MIIDLKKLYQKGVKEENFFFEHEFTESPFDIPSVSFSAPVKVLGKVTVISDKSAVVAASIEVTVKGECTRCLKETEKTFHFEMEESFGGGEDDYPVTNGRIDLTKPCFDAIALGMPMTFLCDDNCEGLKI